MNEYDPRDRRNNWVYSGGNFRYMGEGQWVQTAIDGPFYFMETTRTREYVEIYDRNRGISARLFNDQFYARRDYETNWTPVFPGGWR